MELIYSKKDKSLLVYFGYKPISIKGLRECTANLKQAYPHLTDDMLENLEIKEQIGGDRRNRFTKTFIDMDKVEALCCCTDDKVLVVDDLENVY